MKVRHQISSDNSSKSQPYLNTTVYFFSQTSHTQRKTTIHVQWIRDAFRDASVHLTKNLWLVFTVLTEKAYDKAGLGKISFKERKDTGPLRLFLFPGWLEVSPNKTFSLRAYESQYRNYSYFQITAA